MGADKKGNDEADRPVDRLSVRLDLPPDRGIDEDIRLALEQASRWRYSSTPETAAMAELVVRLVKHLLKAITRTTR